MPIKCFTGLGKYSHLSDKFDADKKAFEKKVKREMTEHEEKELATNIALGFHADITKRLNGIIEEANKIRKENGEKEIISIKGKQEKAAKDVSKIIKEYSKTIKSEENAISKPSTGEILQRQSGGIREQGGERGRVEQSLKGESSTTESKPTEKTTQTEQGGGSGGIDTTKKNEGDGGEGIKITHAATEELRKEHGLGEYQKVAQEEADWVAKANERIKKGEMPDVLDKLRKGDDINEVEQKMVGQHIADLDAEVKKNPTNENISKLEEVVELSDKAGSATGRALRARQGTFLPDDSLGSMLIKEKESMGGADLTKEEIAKITKEHEEITNIKQELEKAKLEIERLEKEAIAKEEFNNQTKQNKQKPTKKSREDFVKERASLKDELKAAKEKHEKWLKDNGISQAGASPFTLTTDMAKVIGKIVKSHAEEAVLKFEDLVNKVYEDAKEVLEGITRNDIIDVMSGKYNEKKETRDEKMARITDYKKEAVLLRKLAEARLNKPKESVAVRSQKAQRIKELEAKIKEIRERNKDNTPIEKTDEQRIQDKIKYITKKIADIQSDVKNGFFEKPTQKPPIILNKKAQALQDRLIELEQQQAIRRAKNDYDKMSKLDKGMDTLYQVLGIRRFINAAIDFSVMFRQAKDITLNPFKYVKVENGTLMKGAATKAWINTFDLAFSPKKFKRFQYELEKSDIGRQFTHFGGVFSNPTEVRMEKREEEFTDNILSRINQKIQVGDNKTLKSAANAVDKIWFSERAAAAALNTIRIEEFANGAKDLQRQGITMENSPKHYKDLAKWVMDITGRGNMIKLLEDSHSGRMFANRTYFGARLMAAKINMLNPATYIKMPKEVRNRALTDMAGSVSGMIMLGLAAKAAGASVELDYDEPDFLQIRFGKNVYDISGGSVAYVRTFLRFVTAMVKQMQHPASKSANSYSKFAGESMQKTLIINKLAPNNAYLYHAWKQKSGDYDEYGKLKPFNPYEIAEIYPLYVDGTVKAFKDGGLAPALSMLLPDMFGIGSQQYKKKKQHTGQIIQKSVAK